MNTKNTFTKLFLFFFTFILSASYAQDCNIGNEDTTDFADVSGMIQANYLLGVKFDLSTNGDLHSLNLIGRNTGAKVQMAVYEDNGGVPGNLVVASNEGTVGKGIVSLSVTAIPLTAGSYWIMAVYNATALHTYKTVLATTNFMYYQALNFGSAIPGNASSFSSIQGQDLCYFMEISCGSLTVRDVYNPGNIAVYPSVSSDFIYLNNLNSHSEIVIMDITGRVIADFINKSTEEKIDIVNLNNGIYFIKLYEGGSMISSEKFVKQ